MKLKATLALLALSASAPALAVISPFGAPPLSADLLGHSFGFVQSPVPAWGIPGLGSGTLKFNLGALVGNGNYTYATSFKFTLLSGVAGVIDQTPAVGPFGYENTTRFSNVTDGALWKTTFIGGNTVLFEAKSTASTLDVGEDFFVNIAFTGKIDPKRFAFSALWDEAPVVPEPSTWAMMLVGFGAVGYAMRRRQRTAVSFA